MPDSTRAITLTSRNNRVFAVVIWILLAAIICTVALTADDRQAFALLPSLAFLALLSYVVLWLPNYVVDDNGVTVRNVFSTVRVPFDALVNVSTKWALTLQTPSDSVAIFAAPQPGRYVSWRVQRRIRREGSPEEQLRLAKVVHIGELPGTESGDGAELIRDRWQAALDSGRVEVGVADSISLERHWNMASILAVALGLVIAFAIAWLVGGR